MIKSCEMCGKDFLTEADAYVIVPSPRGYLYNCGCHLGAEIGLAHKIKYAIKLFKQCQSRQDQYSLAMQYSVFNDYFNKTFVIGGQDDNAP